MHRFTQASCRVSFKHYKCTCTIVILYIYRCGHTDRESGVGQCSQSDRTHYGGCILEDFAKTLTACIISLLCLLLWMCEPLLCEITAIKVYLTTYNSLVIFGNCFRVHICPGMLPGQTHCLNYDSWTGSCSYTLCTGGHFEPDPSLTKKYYTLYFLILGYSHTP